MALSSTAEAAINAALNHRWNEAIRINTLMIKENKNDIATLNRLGYAYSQMGRRILAKTTFLRVLKLDPYNQIAMRHMRNVSGPKKRVSADRSIPNHVSPLWFLEEPGVTKIISCINLAPSETLGSLSPGTELLIKPKNHCVEVRLSPNTYVAALPDDVSFKLIKLISSGNRYRALVKGVSKKSLTLLVREIARGKKFADQPSFTAPQILSDIAIHAPIDKGEEKLQAAEADLE